MKKIAIASAIANLIANTTIETTAVSKKSRSGRTTTTTSTTRVVLPQKEKQTEEVITSLIKAEGWINPITDTKRRRRHGGESKLLSRSFDIRTLTFDAAEMTPDGMISNWRRIGYDYKCIIDNLEPAFQRVKEAAALWDSIPEMFVTNWEKRFFQYILLPENVRDKRVQLILSWVNSEIKEVNDFISALKTKKELEHAHNERMTQLRMEGLRRDLEGMYRDREEAERKERRSKALCAALAEIDRLREELANKEE